MYKMPQNVIYTDFEKSSHSSFWNRNIVISIILNIEFSRIPAAIEPLVSIFWVALTPRF